MSAQSGVLGHWREHLPFTSGLAIDQSDSKVFLATPNGIITLRKDDYSIERLSRSNGLSDVNLTTVGYHPNTGDLFIGYKNGNLDLVHGGSIINVNDIKRSTVVQGGKTIQRIRFIADNAYICTNFGIVVFDMIRREVKSTLYPSLLNPEVFDVLEHEGKIYASTSKGLFYADLDNPFLPYQEAWTREPSLGERPIKQALPFDNGWVAIRYNTQSVEEERDTLFMVRDNTLEVLREGESLTSLAVKGNRLIVTNAYNLFLVENDFSNVIPITQYSSEIGPAPTMALFDKSDDNVFWLSDLGVGLARSAAIYTFAFFTAEGPKTSNAFQIKFDNEVLWVASGAYNVEYSPTYSIEGLFRYKSGDWDDFEYPTPTDYFRDIVSVAIDPADPEHVYAASYGHGVAEMQDGELIQIFNKTTGSMIGLASDSAAEHDIRVADVKLDPEGRLWASVTGSKYPVQMRDADGEWHRFTFSSAINEKFCGPVMIDSLNQVWTILYDRGILISKFEDNSLQGYKLLTDQLGSGSLPSAKPLCMAVDQESQVWVGTSKGIAVFYSPEAILETNTSVNWEAEQIVINQGGFNQYLLEAEEVTAIYVDGANRKWCGTRSAGLFLVSANGEEQIQHFTTENSPLLSNSILTLTMDEKSGELYIGTDLGICSYRTDATRGADKFGHVYAFPNPVDQNYTGPIAITGLVRDTDVKITDVSGNVVYNTTSNGGTAIWNGNLFSGERAATGVYLVFCTNSDGSQTNVTKILLIN
ncbi:MAG: T9SS type A sorting domain-containing protein [Bacteroidia bacterium]